MWCSVYHVHVLRHTVESCRILSTEHYNQLNQSGELLQDVGTVYDHLQNFNVLAIVFVGVHWYDTLNR